MRGIPEHQILTRPRAARPGLAPNILDTNTVVLALCLQEMRIVIQEVMEDVFGPIVEVLQRGLGRMGSP